MNKTFCKKCNTKLQIIQPLRLENFSCPERDSTIISVVYFLEFWPAQQDSNVRTWALKTVGIITYYLNGFHLLNLIFESIIKLIQGVLK